MQDGWGIIGLSAKLCIFMREITNREEFVRDVLVVVNVGSESDTDKLLVITSFAELEVVRN